MVRSFRSRLYCFPFIHWQRICRRFVSSSLFFLTLDNNLNWQFVLSAVFQRAPLQTQNHHHRDENGVDTRKAKCEQTPELLLFRSREFTSSHGAFGVCEGIIFLTYFGKCIICVSRSRPIRFAHTHTHAHLVWRTTDSQSNCKIHMSIRQSKR